MVKYGLLFMSKVPIGGTLIPRGLTTLSGISKFICIITKIFESEERDHSSL